MCDCRFDPRHADADHPSVHFHRVCEFCGDEWAGLHCPHDGYQNPCPACGKRPNPQQDSGPAKFHAEPIRPKCLDFNPETKVRCDHPAVWMPVVVVRPPRRSIPGRDIEDPHQLGQETGAIKVYVHNIALCHEHRWFAERDILNDKGWQQIADACERNGRVRPLRGDARIDVVPVMEGILDCLRTGLLPGCLLSVAPKEGSGDEHPS